MSLNQDGLISTLKIFKQSSSYIKYGQREEMQKKRRGKGRSRTEFWQLSEISFIFLSKKNKIIIFKQFQEI